MFPVHGRLLAEICQARLHCANPKGIDKDVLSLFQTCVGTIIAVWTDYVRERMRLSIKSKGYRLREAVNRRHGQFGGDILHSTMLLMNRTDRDNCLTEDRLNIPTITNFFGKGLFDHPFGVPWKHLLTIG